MRGRNVKNCPHFCFSNSTRFRDIWILENKITGELYILRARGCPAPHTLFNHIRSNTGNSMAIPIR